MSVFFFFFFFSSRRRHTRLQGDWSSDVCSSDLPETGLITGCEMTMAAGEGSTDAGNGVKMAARDRFGSSGAGASAEAGPQPEPEEPEEEDREERGQGLEIYGDSAYGSGQARADYRDGGHDTVIKPGPLRPAVPGGFTIDDFAVDEEQSTVT